VCKVWQTLENHIQLQSTIKKVCQHANQFSAALDDRLKLSQQTRMEKKLLNFWIHANAVLAGLFQDTSESSSNARH